MGTNQERLDALAYGNRVECLLHISRYFFAADRIGEFQAGYNIQSILDAACGLGYGSLILGANHPRASIVGLDLSESAILHCKTLYQRPNVEFVCSDILDAPESDAIVCMETIEHIANWQEAFHSLVTKSKVLIFSVPWKQMANVESKKYHKAFGLYDQSFLDLIPEDYIAEWYAQRRVDTAILDLAEIPEQQRAFLIGVVRRKPKDTDKGAEE